MDVVVKGRHTDIGERLRSHAEAKLTKLAKLDGKVSRIDVEICEEHNRRLADRRSRVELTCRTRGPIVRAEAAAADPYAALDLATTKLEERLRRAADRRRVHHGIRTPVSVAAATARLASNGAAPIPAADTDVAERADGELVDAGPFVVREKAHAAGPMTLDQALFEMELVRARLLPVRRQRFRSAERGLPPSGLRLRGHQAGHDG